MELDLVVFKNTEFVFGIVRVHLLEVYLVTAFVPSETACLASSPGSKRRTAV